MCSLKNHAFLLACQISFISEEVCFKRRRQRGGRFIQVYFRKQRQVPSTLDTSLRKKKWGLQVIWMYLPNQWELSTEDCKILQQHVISPFLIFPEVQTLYIYFLTSKSSKIMIWIIILMTNQELFNPVGFIALNVI